MKYLHVSYNSFKRGLVYQFDVIIGFLLVIVVAVSAQFFWKAFANAGKISANELDKYVTYSVVAAILSSIFTSEMIAAVSDKIKWGSITSDLQKPVDFQIMMISETFGEMSSNLLINFIPKMIVMKLIVDISIPRSIGAFLLFLISALLGYGVLVAFDYLVSLLAFYFVEIWAFQAMKNAIIGFCSGAYLPLWIFPEAILNILNFLPFKYFMFIPLNIYLGELTGNAAVNAMFAQVLWIAALTAAGKILTGIVLKNLTIAGG